MNFISNIVLTHLMLFLNKLLVINKLIINLSLILIFTRISESLLTRIEPKDDVYFEIIEPESLRYTFRARPAQNFGTPFKSSHSHINLVIVEPNDLCSTIVNKLELQSNIGLIERGNDDMYVEMIGDNTTRNCSIPAAFLLGKDGYMIRKTLEALDMNRAIINIPINISQTPLKRKQPPWVVW